MLFAFTLLTYFGIKHPDDASVFCILQADLQFFSVLVNNNNKNKKKSVLSNVNCHHKKNKINANILLYSRVPWD